MDAEQLQALQAPLKSRYKAEPTLAHATLRARGEINVPQLSCQVEGAGEVAPAGLHPLAGGDGLWACSGDMLLRALVACAGVTLAAVATAMGLPVRGGRAEAEGDLDFRGTLGVDRAAPVGFSAIRLHFDLDADAGADPAKLAKLVELTERYCVVFQTLRTPPALSATLSTAGP